MKAELVSDILCNSWGSVSQYYLCVSASPWQEKLYFYEEILWAFIQIHG